MSDRQIWLWFCPNAAPMRRGRTEINTNNYILLLKINQLIIGFILYDGNLQRRQAQRKRDGVLFLSENFKKFKKDPNPFPLRQPKMFLFRSGSNFEKWPSMATFGCVQYCFHVLLLPIACHYTSYMELK